MLLLFLVRSLLGFVWILLPVSNLGPLCDTIAGIAKSVLSGLGLLFEVFHARLGQLALVRDKDVAAPARRLGKRELASPLADLVLWIEKRHHRTLRIDRNAHTLESVISALDTHPRQRAQQQRTTSKASHT